MTSPSRTAESSCRLVVVVTTGLEEYYTALLRGIGPVLLENGLDQIVYVNSMTAPHLPVDLVDVLRHADPVGLICTNLLATGQDAELSRLVRESGLPTVMIGTDVPGLASVRSDNASGMRNLMAHLLDECGVRRPAFVRGVLHQRDSVERETVFREELARRGLPVDEELIIDGDFWYDRAHRATQELLQRRRDLDAVVAANDSMARGCVAALTDAGLRVPEDVLVTGFDNERETLSWPRLTTVDQDIEKQGASAANQLVRRLRGESCPGATLIPSKLVVGGSTSRTGPSDAARLEVAMQALQAARDRASELYASVHLSRGLMAGTDLEDLISSFPSSTGWLQLRRCFIVLRAELCGDPREMPSSLLAGGYGASPDRWEADGSFPVRLLLDYRDGTQHEPPGEVFPAHRLLPDALRDQLSQGVLTVAPLAVGERHYGFMLMERAESKPLVETIHMDLARALDAVLNRRALEAHATMLEEIVDRRTRELQAEVAIRRRAESDLHAEVTTRRRTEMELQTANGELQRRAMQDGLTGLANRAALDSHLELHWGAAGDGGRFAVLIVDVDLFKNYNDELGHVAGDHALRAVAECLAGSVYRPQDLVARYGGEEFVVVLPGGDEHGATTVAMRIQDLLAARAIPHPASTVAAVVTASIGIAVAAVGPELTVADVVSMADRALYRAKAEGRNRAVLIEQNAVGAEAGAEAGA